MSKQNQPGDIGCHMGKENHEGNDTQDLINKLCFAIDNKTN